MTTLRRRRTEVEHARQRLDAAHQSWRDRTVGLRRGVHEQPLIWLGLLGGAGFLAGCLAGGGKGKKGKNRVIWLWKDPAVRWLLRLLQPPPPPPSPPPDDRPGAGRGRNDGA